YRFERALQDRRLSKYIAPFRNRCPWVDPPRTSGGAPTASEGIAAKDVVHGVNLRNAWRNYKASPQGGTAQGDRLVLDNLLDLNTNLTARVAVEAALNELDIAVDAVADLLTAESVFQTVRGNPIATAASLESMSQGLRPPDPMIAAQPREGMIITHRIAVI